MLHDPVPEPLHGAHMEERQRAMAIRLVRQQEEIQRLKQRLEEASETQRRPKKKRPRSKTMAPPSQPVAGSGSEGEEAETPLFPSQIEPDPEEAEQQRTDEQRAALIHQLQEADAETLSRNIRDLLSEEDDPVLSLELGERAVSSTQIPAPPKAPAFRPPRKVAPKAAAPPAVPKPSPSPASQPAPETQEPPASQEAGEHVSAQDQLRAALRDD